jgi:hypothetical protein
MAISKWVDATTNQKTVSAVGWVLERRCKRAEHVGQTWVANEATKKIKIEIAMGPRILMAFFWMGGHNNQPKISRNVGV